MRGEREGYTRRESGWGKGWTFGGREGGREGSSDLCGSVKGGSFDLPEKKRGIFCCDGLLGGDLETLRKGFRAFELKGETEMGRRAKEKKASADKAKQRVEIDSCSLLSSFCAFPTWSKLNSEKDRLLEAKKLSSLRSEGLVMESHTLPSFEISIFLSFPSNPHLLPSPSSLLLSNSPLLKMEATPGDNNHSSTAPLQQTKEQQPAPTQEEGQSRTNEHGHRWKRRQNVSAATRLNRRKHCEWSVLI